MKNKILLLVCFFSLAVFTSKAGNIPAENPVAVQAFKKQFAAAENAVWSTVDNEYSKVAFIWGGHRAEAFYNNNGELVGSVRGIFYTQLPLSVMRSIDKKFATAAIIEISEVNNADGTSYSLEVEYKNKRYKIRFDGVGSLLEKTKK